jgi:hypothetical protein
MWACIEGKSPPSSVKRHAEDTAEPLIQKYRERYPAYLLEVIDWAMEVDPLLRPQNAGEMLDAIVNKTGRTTDSESPPTPQEGLR